MKNNPRTFFLRTVVILHFVIVASGFTQDHTSWTYNKAVYEVNMRQFTKEGTFAAFSKHLDRISDMGVGIIWFMPIHPIGVKNRLGSLGSYYSVRDYYAVNPEFGTSSDFKMLVDSIHSKGMYVMMDWVANHTAWDNVLTTSHPEWYAKGTSGGFIPPPGTNWSDVIQLDYSNQDVRAYMIDAMKYWVTEMNVDGFRYDAASFVPISFWGEVSAALKQIKPGIFLLAEDQGTQYASAGFHMTFGWSFYGFGGGLLPKIYSRQYNANDVANYFISESVAYAGGQYRLYFTSNHDENSWYGTDAELFGPAANAFIAMAMTVRSMPLIYGGQEAMLDHRLKFFDKDEIVWKETTRGAMMKALLQLKRRNVSLWNGASGSEPVRIVTTADQDIYAFVRQKSDSKVFSVFNCSPQSKTFTLTGNAYTGSYKDILSDSLRLLTPDIQMTLPAWGFTVLENQGASVVKDSATMTPDQFSLKQNYPNPFNPTTTIEYSIPAQSQVTVKIFDLLGREVAVQVNEKKDPGQYSVQWNATRLSSGIYFYTLQAGEYHDTKRMVLIK